MAKILFVLPFYSGDKGQAERLGKWILALSKGKKIDANCLLVGSYDSNPSDLIPLFRQSFNGVASIQQQSAPELAGAAPWPRACNHQFLQVAEFIATNEGFDGYDAFYYFEPDNLPLRSDWWELVCAEYNATGKRFWGAKATNIERGDGKAWEDGFHMIGTGIYPRNAWNTVSKLPEIKKANPNRPWDVLIRETVNNQCFFTDLLINLHHTRGFRWDGNKLTAINREPLEGSYARREVVIPESAAIFHGCKDASLRLIVAKKLGIPQTDRLTYLHRGELGDLIYALPAIQWHGGGDLKLAIRMHPYAQGSEQSRHASIVPLLEAQPYIASVRYNDDTYVDFDFSGFRNLYKMTTNLARIQCEWVGADPECVEEKWLTASPTNRKSSGVVVNRTNRYQREGFPWKQIVQAYSGSISFIGGDQEYYEFCQDIGEVPRIEVVDLLEIANRISSSEKFIGNQSCCFAIAEGLKHPRIQETFPERPDCMFKSDSGIYNSNDIPNPDFEKATHVVLPISSEDEFKASEHKFFKENFDTPNFRNLVRICFLTDSDFSEFVKALVSSVKIDKRTKKYRSMNTKEKTCSK